jgi:hypothetical protein
VVRNEGPMEEEEKSKETLPEYKNLKEKLYDKIPITVKALDILILVLIVILVLFIAYFIIRKYY